MLSDVHDLRLPNAWSDLLASAGQDAARLCRSVADALPPGATVPPRHQLLRACEETDPQHTKVLILGQDPYPTPGHACGLAFAVAEGCPPPRSLVNIYKEVTRGCGPGSPRDILSWPRQGVLLLNRWLSLEPEPALKSAWDGLTGHLISALIHHQPTPLVVMGWGMPSITHLMDNTPITHPEACRGPRLFLRASHPSPLSANRSTKSAVAFAGCDHFSIANRWLATHGQSPIHW